MSSKPVSTENEAENQNEMQVAQDSPLADTEGEQVQEQADEQAQQESAEVPGDYGHAEGVG